MFSTASKILFILLLSLTEGYSQIAQSDRFEAEIKGRYDHYEIVPAGELGLLLIRKNEDIVEKNLVGWECVTLDTNLQKRRDDLIMTEYDYELRGHDFYEGRLYLLFEMTTNVIADLSVVEFNVLTGVHKTSKIRKLFNINLSEFEILGKNAILGGSVNLKPAVILSSLEESKTRVLPGFYFERSQLLQIEVNDEARTIKVLTKVQFPGRRNQTINVRTFSSDGEMTENSNLRPDDKVSLLTGRIVNINSNVSLVAGTYGNRRSEFSRGIFLTRIDEGGDKTVLYYDYGDLENFFSYMKARRQEKIKDRIERKKVRGKRAKFFYRLLVHDVIEYGGAFVLIGEAYYPRYNSYSSSGYWLNPYYPGRYSYTTFDGYKYTHAIVIGFDNKGRILWNNSFEIKDAIMYSLEPLVEVSLNGDNIVLLYNYENVIRSKIVQGRDVVEGKEFNDISLKFQDDEVRNNDSDFGGLERWYDDTFYAYGIQKIWNDNEPGIKQSREVFFVNKIIYH